MEKQNDADFIYVNNILYVYFEICIYMQIFKYFDEANTIT